ncbi:MAG: family 78 glycoside hydrolase catalytic domain, partial [Planctomycetes bacterium]|nr:family 78 glycoside hydrolase catalytic domain [Planctomycetota bacterium]
AWPAAKEIAKVGDSPWGIPGQSGGPLRLPPPPYLRKTFTVEKPVVRALAYATALGLYELSINGRRAGDATFTPGWSDYRKRVYYRAIDVTDLIAKGPNAIGAILADGWYAGYVGWGLTRERYGNEPRLRVQLEIDLADGSTQTIATDGTWRAAYGPIREADLLMGETYDARLAMAGWDRAGFDDAAWKAVALTESVVPVVQAYPGVPVKKMLEVPAKKIARPGGGAYVFDLGQNMVGWVRLRVRGEAGDKIVLRFAEMLNPDGTVYTTNLRGARATDTYILRGGDEEIWEPGFTFHGFRYVEVAGLRAAPALDAVTGVVLYSETPAAGLFACSNPMVNQLYRNIVWGQRGNFLEVPTDCPQRDERLGWTGDAQVFIRTATYNMDVAAFFTKWLVDLEDGQQASGAFTHVAPDIGAGAGSPAWADAGIICPYTMYKVYGDTRVIERHYDAMARFIAFLQKTSKGLLRPADGYGDWLSIKADTPKDVIATAYFAYSTRLLSEMAGAIGRTDDAQKYAKLAADVRAAFCKAYLSDDGRVRGDTQTAYAFALYMDLLPPASREAAFRHLVADLEKRDRHISTGFVGVRHLLPVLTRFGRSDIAYTLLENDTYPSWGYSIRHGATTIWERWDGWTEDRGFQDPGMNSFNHYAFGSVGEWMFGTVAGIDLEDPGYARIRIRPQPGGDIAEARGTYRSIRGQIETSWKLEGDTFHLAVSIPANGHATVFVPAKGAEDVTEGGVRAAAAPGVRFIGEEPGAAIFEIGSGRYVFESRRP